MSSDIPALIPFSQTNHQLLSLQDPMEQLNPELMCSVIENSQPDLSLRKCLSFLSTWTGSSASELVIQSTAEGIMLQCHMKYYTEEMKIHWLHKYAHSPSRERKFLNRVMEIAMEMRYACSLTPPSMTAALHVNTIWRFLSIIVLFYCAAWENDYWTMGN